MRLALAVKYFPPLPRVSGIIGFLGVLCRALGQEVELHVVTHRPRGDDRRLIERDGYQIHRVSGPFPLAAGNKTRALQPDATIFVSGIYDANKAGPYIEAFNRLAPAPERRLFLQATHLSGPPSAVLRYALRANDVILAASPVIADALRPAFSDRVHVFTPAIDLPTSPGPMADHPRLGFVNHFNEVKGADLMIPLIEEALDHQPAATAAIAGTGELEPLVRQHFAGNERVLLTGFLGDDERLRLIDSCDIMVLPFRTAVSVLGVSQTVLEVMAAGKVVVGSDTDAINGAIAHDRNGLLGSPESLSVEVRRVQDEPELRRRLGAAARGDAEDRWSIESRVDQLLELLDLQPANRGRSQPG